MYKRNPYIELLNILIFTISMILLKSSIIQIMIILYFLISKKNKYNILLLILGIINLLFGKITILINILLIYEYISDIINKYSERNLIDFYIYIRKKNPQKLWIKVIFFEKYFVENYKKLIYVSKELGYRSKIKLLAFKVKYSYLQSENNIDKLYTLLDKRHFNNNNKNVNILKVDKNDIGNIVKLTLVLIIIIVFGGTRYAIFN